MKVLKIMHDKRSTLVSGWIDLILSTYHADAAVLFKNKTMRFANPVGETIADGVEVLVDEFLKGEFTDKGYSALESIIKIRAVQDFTPSRSLAFVLLFKQILREELGKNISSAETAAEFLALEKQIDDLVLRAFDQYVWSRERLFEIRAREAERKSHMLLRYVNKQMENQGGKPDPCEDKIISLHEAR